MKIVRGSWSTVVRRVVAGVIATLVVTTIWVTPTSAASGIGSGQRVTLTSASPYQSPNGGFVSIDATTKYACALASAGDLYCWGNFNLSGIVTTSGAGTNMGDAPGEVAALSPINLGTNIKVNQFDIGSNSQCAVLSSGAVKCWGDNSQGQLGLGDTTSRYLSTVMGDSLNSVNLGTAVTAIQVGVGNQFACALTNTRTVKCWGDNQFGQLGIGSTSDIGDASGEMAGSLTSVDLNGAAVREMAVGYQHVCVLTSTGLVKCWGKNDAGQLGIGNTNSIGDGAGEMGVSLTSVSLPSGTVQHLFGNSYSTCVQMSVGSYCWGLGYNGVRFDGTENFAGKTSATMGSSLTAMSLGTYEDVMSYSSSPDANGHACVVNTSGDVKCLGINTYGQLGRGDTTTFGTTSTEVGVNLSAVNLGDESSAVQVAVAENFSCALLLTGEVKCWGKNDYGQLGIGNTNSIGDGTGEMGNNLTAVPFSSTIKVQSLGAGGINTCATLTNGTVKCWGQNSSGQLGQGNTTDVGSTTSSMLSLNHIRLRQERSRAIYSGMGHTCAILEDHKIQCWGKNDNGQLGLGDTTNRGDNSNEMGQNLPYVDLGSGAQVMQLALGSNHTCALLETGVVKCWGDNYYGQLGKDNRNDLGDGSGEMGSSLTAINLGTSRRALKISSQGNTSCAVLDNGTAKCWGSNSNGQLGQGSTTTLGDDTGEMAALQAIDLNGFVLDVQVGGYHTCAILDDNSLKCWGKNDEGQLGYGNITQLGDGAGEMGSSLLTVSLRAVVATRTVLSVSLGNAHTCALLNNHSVKCWGKGLSGQLGSESSANLGDGASEMGSNLSTLSLGTGRSAAQISVGSNHSCALLDNGTAKCWGLSNYGQAATATTMGQSANTMGDNLAAITVLENIAPTAIWSAGSTMFQSVSYSLDFSEPITGLTSSDFTTSGTATGCVATSTMMSATSAVVEAECSSDGTVSVNLAAGTATDYAGNLVTSASSSSSVTLDTTAPTATITSPTSPAGTLNPVFRIDFNESVRGIASGDFSVTGTALPCTIVPSATSGTSIDITTQCSSAGTVTLTLISSRVSDFANNSGPSASVVSTQVTIDTSYPTSTITSPSTPRSSRTLSYGVVFNQSVTGFATADVSNVGTASCSTTSVTGSGTTYTVVLTCTTDGTAIMRIAASSVTGSLGAGPTVAENATTVTIDATGPTAAWSTPTSPVGSHTASFNIIFNEDATIGAGDVTSSGTAAGCGTPSASGGPTSWSVSVTCTGDGTVALTLGAGSVTDSLSNSGPTSSTTSSSVTLDTTAPTVLLSTTATTLGIAPFDISVVFSESITGLDGADFSNTGTATGCAFTPSSSAGISFTVSVSCIGAGTVVARLADLSVSDHVGNVGPTSAATTTSVTLDATVPTAEWSLTASVLADRTPEFTITFGAPITGFLSTDISVIGGASGICSVTSLTTTDNIIFTINVSCSADVASVGLRLQAGSVASSSTSTTGPGIAVESGLVTIDTMSPSASWTSSPSPTTSSRTLDYSLTFTETVYGIDAGDFANTGTATGCVYTPTSTSGSSVDISVTCASDGTVVTEVGSSGTIIDIAGNLLLGTPFSSSESMIDTSSVPTGLITLTPSRIINTRPTGKIGNRTGTADPMTFNVYGKGGLPTSGIGAVLLNVTVVDPEVGNEGGYLTVYPCASGRPDASNLNFVSGQIIPNTVIAPVDSAGNICFYSYGKTHVLADVSGYFLTGSSLQTLTPTRIINTRPTGKIGNRTGTADPMTFNVYGKGGLPTSGIGAVLLNVTVVDPEVGNEGGYLTVYPCASGRPDASNLNFVSGQIIPNTVIAPVDSAGNICFYSYGKTHVLADVSGYFPTS